MKYLLLLLLLYSCNSNNSEPSFSKIEAIKLWESSPRLQFKGSHKDISIHIVFIDSSDVTTFVVRNISNRPVEITPIVIEAGATHTFTAPNAMFYDFYLENSKFLSQK